MTGHALMRGERGKIGFLWPADGLNDDEFWAYLPEGVAWLTARYDAGGEDETLTPDNLAAYAAPSVLRGAARLLRASAPDVVACGDHAASFILGLAGERAMRAAISEVAKRPAVTMTGASIDALRALGAKRLAILSPYPADVAARLDQTMAEAGFEVVRSQAAGLCEEADIGMRSAEDWAAAIDADTAAALRRGEADALLVAGGGVRLKAALPMLEARLQAPVVTGPGALVWSAARLLGLAVDPPGASARRAGSPPIETIRRRQSRATKTFVLSDAPPVFVTGRGAQLFDEAGHAYLDFACGSGSSSLGHGHPAIAAALARQLETGVLHLGPHFHAPAQAQLYERLLALFPPPLDRVHPATSGSEATECALKAAMHATAARRFIAFDGGYHGRTWGALSVSAAQGANAALTPTDPPATLLPFPDTAEAGRAAAAAIAAHAAPLAGVLIEPIQATAGCRIANTEGLRAIAAAARERGVPLLVDEVFTGFGRTGTRFAFERYGITPDLVILAKSFGGGLPAGAVVGAAAILDAWPPGAQSATFQLHPAAAATALAFLDAFERDGLAARIDAISARIAQQADRLRAAPNVVDLRGIGAFWAVEMAGPAITKQVRAAALSRGLITWECGQDGAVIGLAPPFIASEQDIDAAVDHLLLAIGDADLAKADLMIVNN